MKQEDTTTINSDGEKFYKIIANRYTQNDINKLNELEEKLTYKTLDTSGLDNKLFKALSKIESEHIKDPEYEKDKDIPILASQNSKKLLFKNKTMINIAKYAAACIFILIFSYILVYFNYKPNKSITNSSQSPISDEVREEEIYEVSPEKIYEKYKEIKLGLTLDEFESLLNNSLKLHTEIKSELSKSYDYVNSDSSISLFIEADKDNKITNKRFSDNKNVLFKPNAGEQEKSSHVIKGMSYQQIKELFGSDGYNISVRNSIFDGGYLEYSKTYLWMFNDESKIEINFFISEDKKEEVSSFNTIPPPLPIPIYDKFKNITKDMKIDDVKKILKLEPVIISEENTKKYKFDDIISVVYDNTNSLVYKNFDYSKKIKPLDYISLEEFFEIKRDMSIDEVVNIIGSDGLLTREVFNDTDTYNKIYTWIFEDNEVRPNGYFLCFFNKENKLVSAGCSGDDVSKINHDENLFAIINSIKPGTTIQEMEAYFNKKALLTISGFYDVYMASFKYLDLDVNFYFYLNNKIASVNINVKDINSFASNALNSDKIKELRNDMQFDEVKNLFGSEGYIKNIEYSSTDEETKKSYLWIFDDKKHIVINFDSATGKISKIETK